MGMVVVRLCHVSDTHGLDISQIPLDGIDVIVHSGDFQPTKGRRMGERIQPVKEWRYQQDWILNKAGKILSDWAGNRPFLLTNGNHDFYPCVDSLKSFGMNATDLFTEDFTPTVIDGISFFGYPNVPFVDGEWNRETQESELAVAARKFPDVDVLVTHAPPYAVLDYDAGHHWGSTAFANEYMYCREGREPRVWMCGHVHGAAGKVPFGPVTLVVNSATIYQIIEINPRVT